MVYSKQWRGEHLRENKEGGGRRSRSRSNVVIERAQECQPGNPGLLSISEPAKNSPPPSSSASKFAWCFPFPPPHSPSSPPWPVRSGPLPENTAADCWFNDSWVRWLSGSFNVIFRSHVPYFNYDCHREKLGCALSSPIAPTAASTMSTVKERQLKAIMHVFRANYDRSHGGGYATSEGVFGNF